MNNANDQIILSPPATPAREFTDPVAATDQLGALYDEAIEFLCSAFTAALKGPVPTQRIRAFYPEIRMTTSSYARRDTRLAFGYVAEPGTHATTVTRPDLFRDYLIQQIALLIENHGLPVQIGASSTPIPVHFAVAQDPGLTVPHEGAAGFTLRDVFDVPDLGTMDDDIINGIVQPAADGTEPLAPFTAQRIDYSLARLTHYTATAPMHF